LAGDIKLMSFEIYVVRLEIIISQKL